MRIKQRLIEKNKGNNDLKSLLLFLALISK
jgi:hypothetical protein